ncbi:MAG: hypothetical protein OXI01_07925, partial [Albidovulum sp.]|nr:hypothetical protein [Albidovulum sp.]
PEIVVHETGNSSRSAGFIRKLVLFGQDGKKTTYDVEYRAEHCPSASRFDFRHHVGAVAEIGVVIDTGHTHSSEGIDAIRLDGILGQ